jgi:serine/threonine-protein kinase RsbW
MAEKDNIFIFQDQNRLVVQFPSLVDHINRVEEETRRFLENNGLTADIFPVCLAMREGLLNAVKHGNRLDPLKTVKYTLKFSDDILSMEVEDQGDGFDWRSIQNIHPSEKAEHGRGIFIMRRYFSGFQYHGKGNRLTLTKYSPANRVTGDKQTNQLEALAQNLLQAPERIRKTSAEELLRLIEDLYARNNRLALQNAELRRAPTWMSDHGHKEKGGGGIVTSLDISSLKQAESKFIRLAAVVEEAEAEILVFDQKGTVEYANMVFLNSSGFTQDTIIDMNYHDSRMEIIGESFTEKMRQVVTAGQPWAGRLFRNRAGGLKEAAVSITPVRDESGAVVGYVSVSNPVNGPGAPEKRSGTI